ncbi:cation:proton antiporter [Halanaerobium sp. Z-7514]|uniref:Cation:proton antiporter n=1 Tax=Halanaerobium polyolivorans TaxID=2886943 RepID=A0AAW4X1S3_9FIRM|nr:cation:proton antiporter [Halanaerobium polyolivorans]MCC3145694.1 cation:proton antiporter [Halanaerobium polyolivorans]
MALSLALILILAMIFINIFDKLKLPSLLGMLVLGVLIGPYGFSLISSDILNISADLRKIALIIILIRAGLGIEKSALKKVGIPAVKMSFLPGIMEGLSIMVLAVYIFSFSVIEAGILAFIIAAVSPAVIVPQMLSLINQNRGVDKGIPTLVLTGASIDDVFAITIFSSFLGLYGGSHLNLRQQIFNVPLSIVIGIILGVITGVFLVYLFKEFHFRDTKKALLILSSAILLTGLEDVLEGIIPIAALIGVMTIGFVLQERYKVVGKRLSSKFNKIWVFAEIMLFVLVGAEVNIYVAFESGLRGLIIILIGLTARSLGVLISVAGTDFNWKERFFTVIAYTPKATVQAAIGAVPLAAGVASGELILAIAVLSILITAPLGAIGIKFTGERWLQKEI